MPTEKKLPIPPQLLVLDFIGIAMAGLGMARQFGNVEAIPEALRFEGYGVILIIAGIALMMPLLLHTIKTALSKKAE